MEEVQKQTEDLSPEAHVDEAADKERTAFCNKFATADELEKAYDSLQREFTKKCQVNSRLSRELEELRNAKVTTDGEPLTARPEGRGNETPTALNGVEATTPVYESPDWECRVGEFMKKYPQAARYTQSIAKTLAGDPSLAMREDCLERAYFDVLVKADRTPEEVVADDDFLEKYVLDNPRVKDRIIEKYLLENLDAEIPRTIAGSGRTHVTPPSRPKSIREAGGIVKNMLANRRI